MNSLVSVIIPVYNAAEYIKETLNSVINQTYPKIEIIIVDDCSSDSSYEIVERYLKKMNVNYLLKKTDKNFGGPAGPRNIGVKLSKGDYVAFLDADDIWHPQKLELQVKLMQKNNHLITCTNKVNFYNEVEVFEVPQEILLVEQTYSKSLMKNCIYLSSVVISKKIGKDNILFNESRKFIGVEDYLLWLNLLEKDNRIYCLEENLLYYRILNNSLSRNKLKHALKVKDVLQYKKPKSYMFFFTTYFFISIFKLVIKKL